MHSFDSANRKNEERQLIPKALNEHLLTAETFIPGSRLEVFAFFAAAENLERITPPELNFQILTPLPVPMAAGTHINYRLRLFGIPFHWKSVISRWEPGHSFVDEQVQGPYAKWVHTHSFRDAEGGTLVTDAVLYQLPWFPLGEVAYPLVRLQLKRIFDFRARCLSELLGRGGRASAP
jgi:ligand-binding SRPBCC domain-containing protein